MAKFILAFFCIISLYGGLSLYIGRRIFQGLAFLFPNINGLIYTALYIILPLSLILGYMPLTLTIKRSMSWLGAYWMGFFVYLLILFLIADLFILLGSLAGIIQSPVPPCIRFYAGLGVILLTTAVTGYGIYNAKQIKVASYDVKVKETKLSGAMKIVMVSDLHLGAVDSEKRLGAMVRGINDLKPDIVCVVGDIFNDDYNAIQRPDEAAALLKGIKSTYGVYASLGNHDGGRTFGEMLNFLEESNIRLLKDEYAIIDGRLALLGRVDPSPIGGFEELKRKNIDEIPYSFGANMPVVVMDHTPTSIEQYDSSVVDLILAGHTHKGQIFPGGLITRAIFTVDYGYYQKDADSPHVIVSSGAGTWGMPMRIGTNNEIVTISLSSR